MARELIIPQNANDFRNLDKGAGGGSSSTLRPVSAGLAAILGKTNHLVRILARNT
jgi:hypothetical protein